MATDDVWSILAVAFIKEMARDSRTDFRCMKWDLLTPGHMILLNLPGY
jgi:hypothetical protein